VSVRVSLRLSKSECESECESLIVSVRVRSDDIVMLVMIMLIM